MPFERLVKQFNTFFAKSKATEILSPSLAEAVLPYTFLSFTHIYKRMATLIFTGGGTAGHCAPCLALLPYLKNEFDKIYYIGSENGIERGMAERAGIPYYGVPCAKLVRSFAPKNLAIPFRVLSGVKRAGKILDEISPDVVFSKGGYVSLPVVMAAKKRGIPVVAHESDYTAGLANKLVAKYCRRVLTAFPETAATVKNGEYAGAPLRRELFTADKTAAMKRFGFTDGKPVLLVMGGSQGARAINAALRAALPDLLPRFNVIHLCGKNNLSGTSERKGYFEAEFLNRAEDAFVCADACVSRAGANSVFELLALNIPCVFVPLPKGNSRGDQVLNAEYFQKLGLCAVLSQSVLTKESLLFSIDSVYADRKNIARRLSNYPVKDASRKIAAIIGEYKPLK